MTIKVKKVVHIEGIGALAKAAGVSVWHLSRVAHGQRKSARLEAFLAEHGIKVEKTRK
jgi:hypothetical protein